MKKFSFPLDRVLSWRQTQVRLAEAALARLNADLQKLELRIAAMGESVGAARSRFLEMPSAVPIEIAALEHFRLSTIAQTVHLQREAQSLEAKIAHQAEVLVGARRAAQLLERLREKRYAAWSSAAAKDVEQQAEESYLARFSREARMQSDGALR
jgi:flagellar export protein FliJ